MELQNLKELLKNHNHVLIDYTDTFINTDFMISNGNNEFMSRASQIYLKMHDKCKQDKYKNVVFLLDISKLVIYNHNFYKLLVKNDGISPKTDIYFLKNSDNKNLASSAITPPITFTRWFNRSSSVILKRLWHAPAFASRAP